MGEAKGWRAKADRVGVMPSFPEIQTQVREFLYALNALPSPDETGFWAFDDESRLHYQIDQGCIELTLVLVLDSIGVRDYSASLGRANGWEWEEYQLACLAFVAEYDA